MTNLRFSRPLAVLALGLAIGGCGRDSDAEAADAAEEPISVGRESVLVVGAESIETGPLISGSLRPEQSATIRAEVGGSVLETHAEVGDAVGRGQRLARIEDTGIRDSYLSAQSAVRSAELAVSVAQRDVERNRTLARGGAIAERNVEVSRNALAASQAQLADARARFALAEEQLGSTRITSPIAGVVSERAVGAGDVIAPGAALYTVVDPSSMELEASVPSDQLSALRVGAPVRFEVRGYPGQTFAGKVDRIAPAADPATRQVPIYVSLPNTGGTLVAGLFAQGRVASEQRQALVVPEAAVDETGATPTVLRLRGGRAERVAVRLGIRDQQAETVEIAAGLAPGDTVLTGAARGVTPGTPVRVGSAAPAAR